MPSLCCCPPPPSCDIPLLPRGWFLFPGDILVLFPLPQPIRYQPRYYFLPIHPPAYFSCFFLPLSCFRSRVRPCCPSSSPHPSQASPLPTRVPQSLRPQRPLDTPTAAGRAMGAGCRPRAAMGCQARLPTGTVPRLPAGRVRRLYLRQDPAIAPWLIEACGCSFRLLGSPAGSSPPSSLGLPGLCLNPACRLRLPALLPASPSLHRCLERSTARTRLQ